MKKLLLLTVVVLAGVAGYLLWQKNATTIVTPKKESSALPTDDKYEWGFVESKADASGTPHTKITLSYRGESYPVGTYAGSCEDKTGELGVFGERADLDEISRIQCWFAGTGDEIGVFQKGQKVIIKSGELGEAGSNGEAFRGNFKTILSL